MDLGVFFFATDYSIDIVELAVELEQRGFSTLLQPEHTHIPASRKTPWPGKDGILPKEYYHTYDPFVALSFAAAATKTLKVGTGICLVPQRDPIVTAKNVASIDKLSGGRFVFGIGGGWNVDEMENHGAEYKTRFKLMRENVLAMKEMWTQEQAEFHGEFVNFDPAFSYPKPIQTPHPPIILGGETDHTLKRVVDYCDGWLPRAKPGFDPAEAKSRLAAMAEDAGRDPSELSITIFRGPEDRAELDKYEAAGIDTVLLQMPTADRDTCMQKLEAFTKLIG
ncbi:MAG: LLM class F420-dependent oxidoreductase [Alphaproteobacteria bacterium]|jgi:probable F420-dependent oxidoreductase|nr:LLM class F420-dependent oxidoreductase [Alphaproteobacteria bacterium]